MTNRKFLASTYVKGDGKTTVFNFSFAGVNTDRQSGATPYLHPEDVHVQELFEDATGAPQVITRTGELVSANSIRIVGEPVAAGREIRIYRETELRFPLVDYRDGQSVSEHDLDLANRQAVFLAQELNDATSSAISLDDSFSYDFMNRRGVNLAPGKNPQDAVNVNQLKHAIRVPESEDVIDALPAPAERANRVLSFDSFGKPTMHVPTYDSAAALRIELADPSNKLVGYRYPDTESVPYTVAARLNTTVHVMDFLTDAQRAAVEAGEVVDCGPELQKAIDAAGNGVLNWPGGALFGTGQELIVRYCQRWTGGGRGKRLYPFMPLNNFNTAIITTGDGTAYKTIKTRRKYRGNANDPQDAPLSAILNVQHQNFDMGDIAIHCWYDPARIQVEPTYLGHDWDCGVFVGCRLHCKLNQVAVTGCFRFAGIYMDVTRGVGLPELFGWDGIRHPEDNQYGGDGCSVNETITWGGRWGLVVLGSQPKEGLISYGKDYTTRLYVTITDAPPTGTITLAGEVFTWVDDASDLRQIQKASTAHECAANLQKAVDELFYSDADAETFRTALFLTADTTTTVVARDANSDTFKKTFTASITGTNVFLSHTSPVRAPDPAPYFDEEMQGTVPDTRGSYGFSDFSITHSQLFGSWHPTKRARARIRSDYNSVLDEGAGSFWIDGLAGNAARKLQGHRYINVRFDGKYDPFNIKMGRTHRDEFFGCHWDGSATVNFTWPGGVPTGNVVSKVKYGPVTNVPELTTLTRFYSQDSTPSNKHFTWNRGCGTLMSGAGRTRLPGDVFLTSGKLMVNNNLTQSAAAELTLNSGTKGNATVRFKAGGDTATLGSIRRAANTGIMTIVNKGTLECSSTAFTLQGHSKATSYINSGGELVLSAVPDLASTALFRIRNVNTSVFRISQEDAVTYLPFRPNTTNSVNLGRADAAWANLYVYNAPTITSDARLKTDIRPLLERELAAGRKLVRSIGIFQWLASVEEKGPERARLHVGQTVQGAIKILVEEGLVASDYGFICYNKWDAEFDAESGETSEAGNQYGFREGPMQNLMLRALAVDLDELTARVLKLETKEV